MGIFCACFRRLLAMALLYAEVKAILKACQLCVNDKCPADVNIIMESDSMEAVAWVTGVGGVGNVRILDYILDIKEILFKCRPRLSVKSISRGVNVAADFLAKQGAMNGLVQEAWACICIIFVV